jgi:hypothetical protein
LIFIIVLNEIAGMENAENERERQRQRRPPHYNNDLSLDACLVDKTLATAKTERI